MFMDPSQQAPVKVVIPRGGDWVPGPSCLHVAFSRGDVVDVRRSQTRFVLYGHVHTVSSH